MCGEAVTLGAVICDHCSRDSTELTESSSLTVTECPRQSKAFITITLTIVKLLF